MHAAFNAEHVRLRTERSISEALEQLGYLVADRSASVLELDRIWARGGEFYGWVERTDGFIVPAHFTDTLVSLDALYGARIERMECFRSRDFPAYKSVFWLSDLTRINGKP